jgi:hypothetical protein
MPFSPLAIPPGTLTLLHVCTLGREAAFWLVSEMFIFISVYNCKKIRAGVLGGLLKKKKKKKMVIHRNNQIQYRFLLLKRPELHNSPVLKYTFFFLHVLRFINKFNYIVKCRIQSHYFVRKKEKRRTSGISNLYNA